MANYTTETSDKLKKKAIKLLCVGFIGLHLFYVGRVKAGIIRLVWGLLCWILIISGISSNEIAMILSGIFFMVVANIPDLIKLLLGTFRDNVGNPLRA